MPVALRAEDKGMEFFWAHFVGFLTMAVAALAMLAMLVCCAGVVKGYKELLHRQAEAEHYRRLAEREAEQMRLAAMMEEEGSGPEPIQELIPPEKRSASKSAPAEERELAAAH